jgi:hypothetical protein
LAKEADVNRLVLALAAAVFSVALAGSPAPEPAGRCVAGIIMPGTGPAAMPVCGSPFYDTTYSFPAPGTWPVGLAWDGTGFWVMDNDSECIYKVDTTGQVLKSFPVPSNRSASGDLEFFGDRLWAVSENSAWLFELDTATGFALDSLRLPDSLSPDPASWGLSWDGAYLWHSQYGSNHRIFQIDTTDGSVVFSFPSPSTFVLGIAWDGVHLWCLYAFGTIYEMNPPDSSIVASYPWPVSYGLGLQWVGENLWNVSGSALAGGTARIYKVDGLAGLAQGRAPEPGTREHTGATIQRAGPYSDLFDATGRRVTNRGPGVYFTCAPAEGGVRTRPVVIVR